MNSASQGCGDVVAARPQEARSGKRITQTAKQYADYTRFGILNPYGRIWTSDTFLTREAARRHVDDFWRNFPDPKARDTSRFTIIPVKVTVAPLPASKAPPETAAPLPGAQDDH